MLCQYAKNKGSSGYALTVFKCIKIDPLPKKYFGICLNFRPPKYFDNFHGNSLAPYLCMIFTVIKGNKAKAYSQSVHQM